MTQRRLPPATTSLVASFLILVAIGTALFVLPVCAAGERPLGFVDALFTATSAVCVTGLTTITVSSDLSLFGQIVLLALIQVGALGIGVLSIALLLAAGRASLQSQAAAGQQLAAVGVNPLRLVSWVVGITAFCEAAGTVALLAAIDGEAEPWPALFHSVSAFCNAGFSLYPDSLERFAASPGVLTIFATLIAVGGLGFLVLREIVLWMRSLVRHGKPRLMLHSRAVLLASMVLWIGGALVFALLENGAAFADVPLVTQMDGAVFQSVTARTAGFNSIDIGALRSVTLFALMLLMFVGGAPGGVAGGVKVTTIVVVLAALRAWIRGSTTVWVFQRTIPTHVVRRSFALLAFSAMFVTLVIGVLLATQDGLDAGSDHALAIAFEAVSAFGTVGLSTGITPELTAIGKVTLVVTMLVGRVGPLVFAVTVLRPRPAPPFEYPEEEMATG